jgi:large subunit ribosomal protein L10
VRLDEKKQIVKELQEKFSRSKVVIVTDYKGLDVATMNELRSKLREADIEYRVVKNTLLRRAAEDTGVSEIVDRFTGPSAIALSYEDPVAPAKVLSEFAKGNNKLEIKVGVMDGKILELSEIKSLSSLPSREVLLGQVLGTMNAVPTGFVRLLSEIPRQFLNVVQAIKDQKEAA